MAIKKHHNEHLLNKIIKVKKMPPMKKIPIVND